MAKRAGRKGAARRAGSPPGAGKRGKTTAAAAAAVQPPGPAPPAIEGGDDEEELQPPALPIEVLEAVLSLCLDHDTLVHCSEVCKAWRESVLGSGRLWEALARARGWGPELDDWLRKGEGGGVQAWYRGRYEQGCYDCGLTCSRMLSVGSLRIRLCRECSATYKARRPAQHRLISAAASKDHFVLRDEHLEGLVYAVDSNPINVAFAPMHLFRVPDIQRRSLARWGTIEVVKKERRKKLLGRR